MPENLHRISSLSIFVMSGKGNESRAEEKLKDMNRLEFFKATSYNNSDVLRNCNMFLRNCAREKRHAKYFFVNFETLANAQIVKFANSRAEWELLSVKRSIGADGKARIFWRFRNCASGRIKAEWSANLSSQDEPYQAFFNIPLMILK